MSKEMQDVTVNRFRLKRGRGLAEKINGIGQELGRPVRILDIGGRPDYWKNVPYQNVEKIVLLNNEEAELHRSTESALFERVLGDARNLETHAAGSFDLVHSNSVIEHVGQWWDMQAMAREALRVGLHGWIQTPAWGFPIEPHYRIPFAHWMPAPLRREYIRMSPGYRNLSLSERRMHVDRINLLTFAEFSLLFTNKHIIREKLLLTKSFVATW